MKARVDVAVHTSRAVLVILLVLVLAKVFDPLTKQMLDELVPFLFVIGLVGVQRDLQLLAAKILPPDESERTVTTDWPRDLFLILLAIGLGVGLGFLVMEWGLR